MKRLAVSSGLVVLLAATSACLHSTEPDPVPVIFDTDLGEDIDDVWALVMLLKSPALDVRLITTSWGNSDSRARSIARILELAGRSDIPIALGEGGDDGEHLMEDWIDDYPLDSYPGTVHKDGVETIIDTVERSEAPITYITVGPPNTLAAVLRRQPDVGSKIDYVGMLGSVRRGYEGAKQIAREWNARADVAATRAVLGADWRSATLAPTDTAGLVNIAGQRFARVNRSDDPLLKALMENYRLWRASRRWPNEIDRSSTLFDSVAVYLAYPGPARLLKLEDVRLAVMRQGFTAESPQGHPVKAALAWKDLDAYRDLLVDTLTGDVTKPSAD